MDELQSAIYVDRFRLAFSTRKGAAFQDWFVAIAGHAFGADFEEVRPYGSAGDLKCDGRRVSTEAVFQCYAPDSMKEAAVIEKIDADFHGARAHWGDAMKIWIFVHNDARGLPPHAVQHIDALRAAHPQIEIEVWSEPELLALVKSLDLPALQALFGYAPSKVIMEGLALPDLAPIIEALERREPDASNPPLTPPSAEKLQKNALSAEVRVFLEVGRWRSGLVATYFGKVGRPDVGERIAEAFRMRYAELRALELPADSIFGYLQNYAGMKGDTKRQGAALAVLAYFFDSCDIFEDPATAEGEP